MRRECGRIRRERLIVADVGDDALETPRARARFAGTCMPQYVITTKSPAILSATVLPPMFGPLMMSSARCIVDCERLRHGTLALRADDARERWRAPALWHNSGATAPVRSATSAFAASRSSRASTSMSASMRTCVRTDGAREPLQHSRDLPLFLDLPACARGCSFRARQEARRRASDRSRSYRARCSAESRRTPL